MRSICIDALPGLRRIAVLEGGTLIDATLDRDQDEPMPGDIYLAKVTKVVPGINAAFLDLDGKHLGFLNRADLPVHLAPKQEAAIDAYLKQDRLLPVQVKKAALNDKAAKVSAIIQIPGLRLICLPMEPGIHFGKDFPGTRESIQETLASTGYGWIVRSGAGMDESRLFQEAKRLQTTFETIEREGSEGKPRLLHRDDPFERCLRNHLKAGIQAIHTDHFPIYNRLKSVILANMPDLAACVRLHDGKPSVFDLFHVTAEIERLRKPKVWLKSGGWLHIQHTEAMTVIDVNSGKDSRRKGKQSPAFRANLEAAAEIPRQLKLRNLGGLFAIDFINAPEKDWKKKVQRQLKQSLDDDATATDSTPINKFGIAQITREQNQPSLTHAWQRTCPTCRGNGLIDRSYTVWHDVLEELARQVRGIDIDEVKVFAGRALFGFLNGNLHLVNQAQEHFGFNLELHEDNAIGSMAFQLHL